MGVRLKSNSPFSSTYTDSLGFNLYGSRRLSVVSDCSNRWSQFRIRKYGSVAQSPAMK